MSEPSIDQNRPERILELTRRLNDVAGNKIAEITSVNRAAKMLSMNAMVVAARAGEHGKGFAVVSQEFKNLSMKIDTVALSLESEVRRDLHELTSIGESILTNLRGQRLTDLALNAIDIIDRNLYERTCDVRWWATDAAIVACLENPTPEAAAHASGRLKVILDAYTVYLDLWICDKAGRVVANGRPQRYPVVSSVSVAQANWFRAAMRLPSGEDFTAADVSSVRELDDAPTATYATAIRSRGETRGEVLGVLGIHFDWQPQAKAVVDGIRLSDEERAHTRVMLLDSGHRVIAASDGLGLLSETFALRPNDKSMGNYVENGVTVGYAQTQGYETYRGMGWYGCVVQGAR